MAWHGHRHGHGWDNSCGPWSAAGERERRWIGARWKGRLHQRLFVWFGVSILVTGFVSGAIALLSQSSSESSWSRETQRVRTFAGHQLAEVWDDPPRRDALVRSIEQDLALQVALKDAAGRTLSGRDFECRRPFEVEVVRSGATLGSAQICMSRHSATAWRFPLVLLVAFGVLWGISGMIARRLTRPLSELARVASDLGAGKLSSRVKIRRHQHGEERMLAEAVNDMATRIEQQLRDQRELLAAVSHELRTPLGHLRLIVELARTNVTDVKPLDEIDREVMEIDRLVGQLLESARLDFATLTLSRLDARDLAVRALERAGLESRLLRVEAEQTHLQADATLVTRALANLLDNARKHAGGVECLRIQGRPGAIAFEVDDRGKGFAPDEAAHAFDAFYSKASGSSRDRETSLGLGLNLVKRTAEAHGGRAYASNRPEGGARVGFELPT